MICGIDEAGRGPWAGDMCVAGVVLNRPIAGLNDSKKLTEKKRELLFDQIIAHSDYKIIFKSVEEIDTKGLSKCLKEAIEVIVEALSATTYIIDGNTTFGVVGVESLIKGDGKVPAIAAASILAKVSRDRYISNLDERYAKYEFHQHKGYGTKRHKALIQQYGFCDLHRRSFDIKV